MPFLQFKGKSAVEAYHYSLPHHTLEPDAALSVLGSGAVPSLDGNIIIEGDNLLALKSLLPTHAGRIKCIYIDPPYNTGNEGWVYNDNLTQPQFKEWIGQTVGKEGEDAARHDKWCCMMYPRLMLLRELLHQEGAIFVSIDDNEHANLRILMDEVFGAENFVATVIWQKNFSPKNSAIWFSEDHDYVIAYARHKETWRPILTERTEEQLLMYSNPDQDPRGPWASSDLSARNYYSKGTYPVDCPGGRHLDGPPPGRYWTIEAAKLWELDADGRIWWGEDRNGVPRLKRFLADVKEGVTPRTIWLHTEAGNTQEAKKALNEVVPVEDLMFQTPKPPRLLEKILALATRDDDIILDSFAGSGTTGQAVLQLNKADQGQRRFILVQQPYDSRENETQRFNICQRLTAERIRRVIQGYDFVGTQYETLLEEKVGLNTLKKADELLKRIESARETGRANYDDVRAEMRDGVVRVEGGRKVNGKTAGIGGSFTYVRVSAKPMLGDYREFTAPLPLYEELAKYLYYTETSREWNPAGLNRETGKIGEHAGVSYYLLYRTESEADWGLNLAFLKRVAVHDPNRTLVIYHEKFLMHREQLKTWETDNGKHVRSMQIPFQLR